MITIQYNSVDCRVQLSGHAGSGDPGHDLVCSAVSALTYTLEANVKSLEQAGIVRDVEIKLNHGDAVIACKPCADDVSSYVVRRIMAAVCAGYELLADRYPENIRYDVERKIL